MQPIDAELAVVVVGTAALPAYAAAASLQFRHLPRLRRIARMPGQRRKDQTLAAAFGGIGSLHAASLNAAANSSGRDQHDTVDKGSTNRKSSSAQTSAVSSNSETKVRASGPAAR